MTRMILERISGVPGLTALRALASERGGGLWLVGGAVRDALLGADVRDLDVVVEGDAREVARRLGDVAAEHERFGTAEVRLDGGMVNLATARTETYSAPGALPDVRLGATIEEDLRRRDFTVNAIAVDLAGGRVVEFPGARADLDARRLRTLHDRSFVDDPTRAYRLARYAQRLGLDVEEQTATLARAADWRTVSADRVANEVRLMLGEPDAVATLVTARAWLGDGVPPVDATVARAALALLPADGRPDVLLVPGAEWARRMGGGEAEARRADLVARADELAAGMLAASRPSEIAAAVAGWPIEAVALAGALGADAPARAWIEKLRHVDLQIDGRDVIAAGVPEGPAVGEALGRALAARLDGAIPDSREAELRAAVEG
jgi:tRNA nucleotidyltransferase (CCA-adding enzyme)